jgi:hypothetical protein
MTNDLTIGEMADDVLGLLTGATAIFLPAYLLAVPCIVLVVVPVIVVGVVLAVLGAILAAPLLLVRAVRRRVSSPPWPAGTTSSRSASASPASR